MATGKSRNLHRYTTFDSLQAQLQEDYQRGDYTAALDLAKESLADFPAQQHLLYYWLITMSARVGDQSDAIEYLREILETGFWYGEFMLRKNASLKELQGRDDFESLVALNQELMDADQTKSYPLLTLRSERRCGAGGPACPLLMALHADGGTARSAVDFWRPAASAGFLVALPQSSQAFWKGAYTWSDRETNEREVRKHFNSLTGQYNLDQSRVILGGQGLGAAVAIQLALQKVLPSRGFIAIHPSGLLAEEHEKLEGLRQELPEADLRAYLIVGEREGAAQQEVVASMQALLRKGGIACELERVPEAGYADAELYHPSLLRALEYVMQ